MNTVAVNTNTVCKGFGQGETRTEVLKDGEKKHPSYQLVANPRYAA